MLTEESASCGFKGYYGPFITAGKGEVALRRRTLSVMVSVKSKDVGKEQNEGLTLAHRLQQYPGKNRT